MFVGLKSLQSGFFFNQSYLEYWQMSLAAYICVSLRVCCPFWQSGVSMPVSQSPECEVGQLRFEWP